MSVDYTVEEPYGPLPGIRYYNVVWKPIYGRTEMALPEAGTRRQAVEAFVLWTRDVEDNRDTLGSGVLTLEESLCTCVAPVIPGVTPELRHDCPWCELRKAFGLLEGA